MSLEAVPGSIADEGQMSASPISTGAGWRQDGFDLTRRRSRNLAVFGAQSDVD
jgi:hypothetical protein